MIELFNNCPEVVIRSQGAARDCPVQLVEHVDDLFGEAHGFGSFLFDTKGQMVHYNGVTWLYTTVLNGDKWESWARSFEIKTMKTGPARRVLVAVPEDRRGAVLHHVVSVSPNFIVGFFSGGTGVRAAIAQDPEGDFIRDHNFRINPVRGWETRGDAPDDWFLEANGAFVEIQEDADGLIFWEGYDSYLAKGRLGDMAWAKVKVDKKARNVTLVERHPKNPLPFRDPSWSCARCGGNLNRDVRVDGRYVFFYYFRPLDSSRVFIGMALSRDPLFQTDTEHFVVDSMRGKEAVAEKFQFIRQHNELLLFSENRFKDGSWHTGMRRFLITR